MRFWVRVSRVDVWVCEFLLRSVVGAVVVLAKHCIYE